MRLSKYTIVHRDYPGKGTHLAWSGLSEALVELNDEVLDKLSDAEQGVALSDTEQEALQPLLDAGITVPLDADENALWTKQMNQARADRSEIRATILTTWACNLACPYCIEGYGAASKGNMSLETAARTGDWLIAAAGEECKEIRLMFYGGEPLLNLSVIEDLARRMNSHCAERGIESFYSLVSNGVLLDEKVAEFLADLGVSKVQLTLDGDKEAHDARRPSKDGSSSYDAIMRNLPGIIKHLEVFLGGNIDEGNRQAALRLLDELATRGLQDKLGEVDFMPVTARFGPGESMSAEGMGMTSMTRENMLDMLELKKQVVARGFRTSGALGRNICPIFLGENATTIDPAGEIYKCPAFMGKSDYQVGRVEEPGLNTRHQQIAGNRFWEQECADCPYLPMCGGGCRFMAVLNGKKEDEIYCLKEVLEEVTPRLMEFDHSRECALAT